MPVPFEVQAVLRKLETAVHTGAFADALDHWENANRSLTTAILAGMHRVPVTAQLLLFLGGFLANPIVGGVAAMAAPLKSGSLLEAVIRVLERRYRKEGRLDHITRKHFEELTQAIAAADAKKLW